MTKNKQIQKGGSDSTNIQAGTINQYGVSYADAKDIALQTFRANFYELSEIAKKTAEERAEELVNVFLEKLGNESPEQIQKIEEPDLQYAVVNAQKNYARDGQPESLELLSNLLKMRFQMTEKTLKAIVLNEAIEVSAKITSRQIKYITSLFLVKNCKVANGRLLIEVLAKIMGDELDITNKDNAFFEHLVFAGIASNDIMTTSGQNLEYFIRDKYSDELIEEVEGSTLDILDPPVRKQFVVDSLSSSVFSYWNRSFIKLYSLTSVGQAIALAYYNEVAGAKINLSVWIND